MSQNTFGDSANTWSLYDRLDWIFGAPWSPWHIVLRCRNCGTGYEIAEKGKESQHSGNKRWLCVQCGSDVTRLVTWVGRKTLDQYDPRQHDERWQWLPEDKLPPDLRPDGKKTEFELAVEQAVEQELPKRLDAEFEARVKAAVEVEMSTQRAQGKSAP